MPRRLPPRRYHDAPCYFYECRCAAAPYADDALIITLMFTMRFLITPTMSLGFYFRHASMMSPDFFYFSAPFSACRCSPCRHAFSRWVYFSRRRCFDDILCLPLRCFFFFFFPFHHVYHAALYVPLDVTLLCACFAAAKAYKHFDAPVRDADDDALLMRSAVSASLLRAAS